MGKPVAEPPWAHTDINPRTGQVWRLSDEEVAPYVEAEARKVLRSPATARAYLIKNGFLTKSGRIQKKYGGSR